MDLADDELEGFTQDDKMEIALNIGASHGGDILPRAHAGGSGEAVGPAASPDIVALVAESIDAGIVPAPEASTSVDEDVAVPLPAPLLPNPWDDFSAPDERGYVYPSDSFRAVCRFQRGKPAKNRNTFTCYFHPGCQLLINDKKLPPLQDLYEWLFEVPAPDPSDTAVQRQELAQFHLALGKSKWS